MKETLSPSTAGFAGMPRAPRSTNSACPVNGWTQDSSVRLLVTTYFYSTPSGVGISPSQLMTPSSWVAPLVAEPSTYVVPAGSWSSMV